jgi:hypothetical protein
MNEHFRDRLPQSTGIYVSPIRAVTSNAEHLMEKLNINEYFQCALDRPLLQDFCEQMHVFDLQSREFGLIEQLNVSEGQIINMNIKFVSSVRTIWRRKYSLKIGAPKNESGFQTQLLEFWAFPVVPGWALSYELLLAQDCFDRVYVDARSLTPRMIFGAFYRARSGHFLHNTLFKSNKYVKSSETDFDNIASAAKRVVKMKTLDFDRQVFQMQLSEGDLCWRDEKSFTACLKLFVDHERRNFTTICGKRSLKILQTKKIFSAMARIDLSEYTTTVQTVVIKVDPTTVFSSILFRKLASPSSLILNFPHTIKDAYLILGDLWIRRFPLLLFENCDMLNATVFFVTQNK